VAVRNTNTIRLYTRYSWQCTFAPTQHLPCEPAANHNPYKLLSMRFDDVARQLPSLKRTTQSQIQAVRLMDVEEKSRALIVDQQCASSLLLQGDKQEVYAKGGRGGSNRITALHTEKTRLARKKGGQTHCAAGCLPLRMLSEHHLDRRAWRKLVPLAEGMMRGLWFDRASLLRIQ
jgi:hypothetical protein